MEINSWSQLPTPDHQPFHVLQDQDGFENAMTLLPESIKRKIHFEPPLLGISSFFINNSNEPSTLLYVYHRILWNDPIQLGEIGDLVRRIKVKRSTDA